MSLRHPALLILMSAFIAPFACGERTIVRRVMVERALGLVAAARLSPIDRAAADGLETIRQAAASIPGYGAPDIYYPELFRGRWTAERRVYDVQEPLASSTPGLVAVADEAKRLLGAGSLQYDVRFLSREGHVIADRAFNTESLAAAAHPSSTTSLERPQAEWSASNPNILTLREGPRLVEYKVTRRASEAPSDNTFGTSEYERVADAGSAGIVSAVPLIQARRVEARYKWAAPTEEGDIVDQIDSLERVSWFDPTQTGFADLRGASPALVVKARIKFRRVPK